MKQHFQSQNRPKTGYNKSYYNNYNKKQGYYKSKPQYNKTRNTNEKKKKKKKYRKHRN